MKRWESLIFFQFMFYWSKGFSPKTLLMWQFSKNILYCNWNILKQLCCWHNGSWRSSRVTTCAKSACILSTGLFILEIYFSTTLLRANYFSSLVQRSIRLHARWLWLMVVILFGHNVVLLGNWRWVQGWQKAFLNPELLWKIEPLCSFPATSWLAAYKACVQAYWSCGHPFDWSATAKPSMPNLCSS